MVEQCTSVAKNADIFITNPLRAANSESITFGSNSTLVGSPATPTKIKFTGEAVEGEEVEVEVILRKKIQTVKIFNLSKRTLSPAETSLLCRGLNFAPSNKPDPFVLFKDLNRYIRNLTLKRFFQIKNAKSIPQLDNLEPILTSESPVELKEFDFDIEMIEMLEQLFHDDSYTGLDLYTQHPHTYPPVIYCTLKPKSIFYPYQSKGPYLTTFYNVVFSDLKKMCSRTTPNTKDLGCLDPKERLALLSLTKNYDLIIKNADKGGRIIIQNQTNYIWEAERVLADRSTYCKLSTDPLPQYQIEKKKN